jgi:uncharacterized repeat protein (TIGR01451 family)
MNQTMKANIQILVILFVATVLLICLSIVLGNGIQPQIAIAQEPLDNLEAARRSFSKEKLAAFGLTLKDIEAAAGPYNLQVTVNVNNPSIPSGGSVIYTVRLRNLGPNPAQYILFSQILPPGMTGGSPNFAGGGVTAISNGLNPPTWLITNQIASNSFIQFTVSGAISSVCNTLTTYTASAIPFNSSEDTNPGNNTGARSVNIVGGKKCSYFALIRKDPTPTPNPIVFFDNFSGDRNWPTADSSDCDRTYTNGEYEIKVKTDNTLCFGPAPGAAERQFGTFKVKVRRDGGGSNFTVAIYTNGQGADNYYGFEVKPDNDCSWRLIRRSGGSQSTARSGGCESVINRGSASNILEIRHSSNSNISVFVNGTQVGATYHDGSQLNGRGTGVYVVTHNSDDVTTRFDDFTVTALP